ncbi:glycoside hydrolase family 53 protein [Mucilaginibacter phyllosphaerae]|uniref:Arabinogalactan endo-beta-1,4-galactanase n=1 Tax=Mucilaginibacter phyllosphaerae TaxID=1812349 RepID=A0A4Y8AC07_9SPHI|nr:glycosyl hydrolase 53 family protein [Mucilaginibacter phyllosphaerae]MBB3969183.1 arabinogalactan endo-1,4-beta-galactosidase [Mucilaginibacter phyllosphaerae]TEW66010.1 arabinogalactan endo-1,4-beta-galactosidase [Mucilaginibacter phyllosphaerae]GGH06852.1 arabinogalactan endo-beta-1,4-galactanase [Mucilaginibacter phyllosphaerae]
MRKLFIAIGIISASLIGSCTKDITAPDFPDEPLAANFAKGADVSWVTEMENSGLKFYNNAGTQQDLLQILKDKGINSIRLRAWVNPASQWSSTADVVAKAVRAKAMGFRIMLDLHYSDTWADPAAQAKPAAWANQDFAALKTSVTNYTIGIMNALKTANIAPEWVQIGNETNNGMLWEDGKASVNMKNYAELVQAGYAAVKSVNSSSKVIVHLSNGFDNTLFRFIFDGLKANGANWDVTGMSLYPTADNWRSLNIQCLANMNDMVTRYGKEVMICEVGMPATEATASKAFLTDIIRKNNSLAGGKGLGVFYWEPEAYNDWQGYKLGAFDATGKPTAAMDAFLLK